MPYDPATALAQYSYTIEEDWSHKAFIKKTPLTYQDAFPGLVDNAIVACSGNQDVRQHLFISTWRLAGPPIDVETPLQRNHVLHISFHSWQTL